MRHGPEFVTHACKAGGWKCGQYRDEARWTGHVAGHCTSCGETLLGGDAFDRHYVHDDQGRIVCLDLATQTRQDGSPVFEKVPKPTWDPPYAWRRSRPERPEAPKHWARARRTTAAPLPRGSGSPDPQTVTESGAGDTSEVAP